MAGEHITQIYKPELLPFARSRIRAIRASGMRSGAQKFVMGNAGVYVKVDGNQDFIHIYRVKEIDMTTGLVDLGQILFRLEKPSIFTPGKLWYGKGVDAHPPAFSAGALTHVLTDVNDLRAIDAALVGKKYGARWCPPSIFTGKCRLYVQSIMGASLYSGRDLTPNPYPALVPNLPAIPRPPPTLILPGYGEVNTTVTIDTSTGVIWDSATNKHWIFVVRGNGYGVEVYELRSDSSTTDREAFAESGGTDEKLESRILATSYPLMSSLQSLATIPNLPILACGYGWHWAWTNAVCDIVVNFRYEQNETGSREGMVAYHYRLVFTPTHIKDDPVDPNLITATTWALELQLISGPTQWSMNSQAWVIASPMFGLDQLQPFAPIHSYPETSTGAFYVFYRRDELVLCEFEGTVTESVTTHPDSNDEYLEGWVLGGGSGSYNTIYTGPSTSGRFVIGALGSTPITPQSYDTVGRGSAYCIGTTRYYFRTVSDLVSMTGGPDGNPTGQVGENVWTSWVNFGYPGNPNPGNTRPFIDQGLFVNVLYQETVQKTCQNIAVIPFYDSQAIFLYSTSRTLKTVINDVRRSSHADIGIGAEGAGARLAVMWCKPANGLGGTGYTPVETESDFQETCKLHTAVGSADASISSYDMFMLTTINMEISTTMATTSGINTQSPSIISPGQMQPVNPWLYRAHVRLPIVVGWA